MPTFTHRTAHEASTTKLARWPGMTGALALLGATVLGLVHAFTVPGFGVLSAQWRTWVNPAGDLAQSVMGAEAYLADRAWHFPIAATGRLWADGHPLSIVYTDSAPWIAVLIKAAGDASAGISIMGVVLVLSFVLLPVAFAALLLAAGIKRIEVLLLGTALGSLFPAWYIRTSGHLALSSHWVFVFALAAAVQAVRKGVTTPLVCAVCCLGALSIGLHAYLFVMVSAIAMGAIFADFGRRGRIELLRALKGLAGYVASAGVAAWLLGYAAGGGGVGGFGMYSMNLLSPFVPQISGWRQLLTGEPGRVLDATGGQYNGYNYLGAGVLLTLLLGLVLGRLGGGHETARDRRQIVRAGIPLLVAGMILFAMAVSNRVSIGHVRIFAVDLPGRLLAVLDEIRGSGRLFWPVSYALLALALTKLSGARKRSTVAALLTLAVALQLVDTQPLRQITHTEFTGPATPADPGLAAWGDDHLGDRDVRFLPRFLCTTREDQDLMRMFSLRIIRSGGSVAGGPAARMPDSSCRDDKFLAITSQAPPGWVDVVMLRSVSASVAAIAGQVRPCTMTGWSLVCDARRPGVAMQAVLPVAPLRNGVVEKLSDSQDGPRLLVAGWSQPETAFTWTDRTHALLALPLPSGWTGPARLTIAAQGFAPPPMVTQDVTVRVAGTAVATWKTRLQPADFTADIPVVPGSRLAIVEFEIPAAVSPRHMGTGTDTRRLGMAIHTLQIAAIQP